MTLWGGPRGRQPVELTALDLLRNAVAISLSRGARLPLAIVDDVPEPYALLEEWGFIDVLPLPLPGTDMIMTITDEGWIALGLQLGGEA